MTAENMAQFGPGHNAPAPVVFERGGSIFTNSRDVAVSFDRNHRDVLRDVDNLLKNIDCAKMRSALFIETKLPDSQGINRRSYDMTRDGFTLLAMGFTGAKALQFKLRYIAAFNAMEAALRARAEQEAEVMAIRPPELPAGGDDLTPREVNAWTGYLNMARNVFGRETAAKLYDRTPLPKLTEDRAPAAALPVELDGHACLEHLLAARIGRGRAELPVADLLTIARRDARTREQSGAWGLFVNPTNLKGWVAIALPQHPTLQRAFALTDWAPDWGAALLSLPGASRSPGDILFPDRMRRAVLLPWEVIERYIRSAGAGRAAAE